MRHPIASATALTCVLLVCCALAFALDPSLDISQYAHTSWKVRDGFTKGSILSLTQTPDGYVWLGTEFGLVRFDGERAVPWRPPGSQPLPADRIMSLLVSQDGTLWIGTKKGLANWKGSTLTRFRQLDGESIYALLEDREGTLWVGAGGSPRSGELCAIRGGTVDCFGGDGQLGSAVTALNEERNGTLWVGVPEGLWRWKPGPRKFYTLPGELNGPQALADDDDGTLLVGKKDGLYRFVEGKMELYPLPGISRKFQAKRIVRDRNASLWVATWNYGLVHLHQGRTDVFSASDGLSGDDVQNLFEDREGNVWVSTLAGLDRFHDLGIATVTAKQGLSRDLVGSVLADKDGGVWLATYGGLNRLNHGQITTPQIDKVRNGKIHGLAPNCLFQNERGRIWVSTPRQLGYLEDGKFTSIEGAPAGNILSVAQDNASNLWVANEVIGLVRISPENDVRSFPWSGLGHMDHASVLAADGRLGGLWIGFVQGGIAYFSGGQVRKSYTDADGLAAGRVSDLYFDHQGMLWISTEGGLSRLKNSGLATLTSKNGLPCDTVHWAIEDDDHSMWLYTACGLVRLARSELEAWSTAADSQKDANRRIQVTVFDNSDGVKSLSNPGNYHPQVAKTPDGRLWFLPWDGVSVIDPRHLPFNKLPPPVHIEQITADGRTYDPAQGLRLPPRIQHIDIDYTALSLVAPEKNRFRFRLEGYDRDWRDVGDRRQAFYTNLPPRHYTFRVKASNNSGVWNEAGASLEFSVLPAFYETNWFRALCVIAFLALAWAVYQLRVQQLQRQFAIRLNERTRIARELHDTFLQTIQGSKLVADDALEHLNDPIRTRRSLQRLSDWLERATKEGRAALHALRASATEENELAAALLRALEDCRKDTSMEVQFAATGDARDMHPIVRNEVYRIGYEAIRNACAHSKSTQLEVGLNYSRDLSLRVRDNGVGIDPAVVEKGKQGHLGLQGMRERAAGIGSKLTVVSSPNSGTEVTLLVPGRVVFRKRSQRLAEKIRTRIDRLS